MLKRRLGFFAKVRSFEANHFFLQNLLGYLLSAGWMYSLPFAFWLILPFYHSLLTIWQQEQPFQRYTYVGPCHIHVTRYNIYVK